MFIYKITNLVNGKVYVGQTVQKLSQRYRTHKWAALKQERNLPLYNSMRKYGFDNFKVELLEECVCREDLNKRERFWIEFFDSIDKDKGYNLTLGGGQNWVSLSEETRQKKSQEVKDYWKNASPEVWAKNTEHLRRIAGTSDYSKGLESHMCRVEVTTKYKEIILKMISESYSVQEIKEFTGIAVNTIKTHLTYWGFSSLGACRESFGLPFTCKRYKKEREARNLL